ncbi:hypothetical protein ACHQM5_029427 [Ranunculus cassubicifolius]
MARTINHYEILSLPPGKESTKLSITDIRKAYKSKALELHPDKNPNDPNANAKFHQLKSSFDILVSPNTRKIFDNYLLRRQHDPASKTRQQKRRWGMPERDYDDMIRRKMDDELKKEEERRMKMMAAVVVDDDSLEQHVKSWRDFMSFRSRNK